MGINSNWQPLECESFNRWGKHLLIFMPNLIVTGPLKVLSTADVFAFTMYTKRQELHNIPDSKVHGANMGPTWVLPAPGGPHVGPLLSGIPAKVNLSTVK